LNLLESNSFAKISLFVDFDAKTTLFMFLFFSS
jgi:hypothetical protein